MLSDREKNFVSLVVYIYNEEENILSFLNGVTKELESNFERYEIICVNDASTDNSAKLIKEYAKTMSGRGVLSSIHMSYYQGIEAGINAGVDLSIGDFVFEVDSAFIDYETKLFMEAYRLALQGFDIVSVAPEKNRNGFSTLFYAVYNKVSNTQNTLRTERFRVLSRRAINRIHSMSKNIPYRKPIYANCGLPANCILFQPNKQLKWKEQRKLSNRQDMAINSLILFTDVAYRVSLLFSVIMILGAASGGVYVASVYLNSKPVEGWTTTMMFLALGFCAVFILFVVVIKYLSIILNMIFKRQNYLIDSIEKYGR